MYERRGDDLFLADCPARTAIELLADKWTVVVLAGLSRGPVRRSDLLALIGAVSGKVLTQTLRRLQARGLVARLSYAEAPPRVEYELTDLGTTLIDPILTLASWARDYGVEVQDALDQDAAPVG